MGRKKKQNQQNKQEKSSNQSEQQPKKDEAKSQQQQEKQNKQLFPEQSNKHTEQEQTRSDSENSPQVSNQQSSLPNPQTAQMQSSKQSGKGKQKDWPCPKCSKVNFGRNNVCKECNEPKPAPPEQPKEEPQTSNSLTIPLASSISNLNISSSCEVETNLDAKKFYEGTRGRKCTVEVNYVELNLKNLSKTCYHYDVSFVPNTPKKMLPAALDEFMRSFFKGHIYGFDGRSNMITNKKLNDDNSEFTGNVEAYFGDRKRSFDVTVKLVSEDNMEALKNYKNDGKPAKANQNLDIILKSVFRKQIENGSAVRAGRNLFFVPKNGEKEDLSDGMELWHGLFQSAILGRAKVYLNIDVLHKAFPSPVHLLDYLKGPRQMKVPEFLNDAQKKNLNDFLKTLTIGYRLSQADPLKTYVFNGLGDSVSKASFEFNGKKITVKDYFEKEKKIQIKFPMLPVLRVGSKTKSILLPLEFCELPPGQVTNKTCSKFVIQKLTNFSVTSPEVRKDKIRHLLAMISYNMDPTIKGFGIEVGQKFQNVEARVINPPNLRYMNKTVTPSRGAWNAETFLEVKANPIKWCIIRGGLIDPNKIDGLKKDLIQEAKKQNIILEDIKVNNIISMKLADNKENVKQKFLELKNSGYQLVVAVISNDKDYQVVKNTSELSVGILTTCIKEFTILNRLGGNNATVRNILIKLNAKLNGRNHEVDEKSFNAIKSCGGTMFVGADVTHPSPDQKCIPSIIGVVSSYDQVGTKYIPAWRVQKPGVEMIQDLENILMDHIKVYENFNNKLPQRIMYYRDGVSDSQFKEVLQVEMTAIRKALTTIYGQDKPAEVTFVVVQKRHHTRLFPTDGNFADKNGNILPGTVVDKDIVHPFEYQFFMASHTSLKGVTKPAKYCILLNESKIYADDIQAITFDLCHLFSRCTRSVSYPAPTYYAHLVAARGRNYFDKNDNEEIMKNVELANQKFQNNGINQRFVSESPMYFI